MCFVGPLDLSTLCKELGTVKGKYTQIGVHLGVPYNKLQEMKREDFPLAALLNYCLEGNVKGQPLTWKAIVDALRSDTVEEAKLAEKIEKQYCQQDTISCFKIPMKKKG